MELTLNYINKLIYNDGKPLPEGTIAKRDVRWDSKIPGFGVRIYPSGKKTYILSYRISGRKRLITLGRDGAITLIEARAKAKSEIGKISDNRDPLAERKQAAKGETIKALCSDYLNKYAKVHKKSWKDDDRRIEKHILPAWSNRHIDSITKQDALSLHSRIGDNAIYEANRIIRLISKMFAYAVERGFIPESSPNPARGVKLFKEEKRDRWITPEELPFLAEAIDTEQSLYGRSAIWLYLLTGARKTEFLEAKWEHIDWARGEIKLPDTKADRVHYIPLSKPAIELLKHLPRIDGNPYILPGRKTGKHLINISKPWIRIRQTATIKSWQQNSKFAALVEAAKANLKGIYSIEQLYNATLELATKKKITLPTGIVDVRVHDLRRTIGSWLAQSGNSLHLIGKVLNHSNQSTTAVYARFAQDHVRQALEDHGEKLMIAAGKQKSDNVVPMKKTSTQAL